MSASARSNGLVLAWLPVPPRVMLASELMLLPASVIVPAPFPAVPGPPVSLELAMIEFFSVKVPPLFPTAPPLAAPVEPAVPGVPPL